MCLCLLLLSCAAFPLAAADGAAACVCVCVSAGRNNIRWAAQQLNCPSASSAACASALSPPPFPHFTTFFLRNARGAINSAANPLMYVSARWLSRHRGRPLARSWPAWRFMACAV